MFDPSNPHAVFAGFQINKVQPYQDLFASAEQSTKDIRIYNSGSSNPQDFAGFAKADNPIGVVINRISKPMMQACRQFLLEGGFLFVDSGAFSIKPGVDKPLDVPKVFSGYWSLLKGIPNPGHLQLVMPDVLNQQAQTLALLEAYQAEIREFIVSGADVIVPFQIGELEPYAYYDLIISVLKTDRFRLGLPTRSKHFGLKQLHRVFAGHRKPQSLHLLGVATNLVKMTHFADAIRMHVPMADITADGCSIRSKLGEGESLTEGQREIKRSMGQAIESMESMLRASYPDDRLIETAVREMLLALPKYRDDFSEEEGERRDQLEEAAQSFWMCATAPGALDEEEYQFLASKLIYGKELAQFAVHYWRENGFHLLSYVDDVEGAEETIANSRSIVVNHLAMLEQQGMKVKKSRAGQYKRAA